MVRVLLYHHFGSQDVLATEDEPVALYCTHDKVGLLSSDFVRPVALFVVGCQRHGRKDPCAQQFFCLFQAFVATASCNVEVFTIKRNGFERATKFPTVAVVKQLVYDETGAPHKVLLNYEFL